MKTGSAAKTRKGEKPLDKIYDLRLYVIDRTLKSVAAVANLTRICHARLRDNCHIVVIDIEKKPGLAKENNIVAIPTLVRMFPLPMRKVIGDLSDADRVLIGLDLHPTTKYDVRLPCRIHGSHGRQVQGGQKIQRGEP
jgi:circadian clock protein KaiB